MTLSPTIEKFILHWGEMGTRWGVNRTVAQIHALLYIADKPLHAEEIATTLSVARSNVSMSLRELQGWGIIRTVPVLGDRREHYQSMTDVWEMFQIIMDERKKREIDPTLALLRQCIAEADKDKSAPPHVRQRLEDLQSFFETMTGWYAQMRRLPTSTLVSFCRMGAKVKKFLGLAS